MKPQFFFVEAKKIPYKALIFEDCREIMVLSKEKKSLAEIREYFHVLEKKIKEGFYALGFISYELGYLLEERLNKLYWEPQTPLAYFALFKRWHKVQLHPQEVERNYSLQVKGLNLSSKEYEEALRKIKNYIAQGDTYQVNFTAKLKFTLSGDPWSLFKALLFSQRCEYAFFMETPDFFLLSLSPELFLEKKGLRLLSAPMKGTLKRAPLLHQDELQKESLREDPKSRAENIMIVDLIRNDLGRIAIPGSVWVKELFQIKTYPTLHQMISLIEGTIKEASLFDILKALFPCGSVTGAPKIRTMEIIRELEKEPRNVYTGAVGYLTPEGDFLFNVAIRTILLQKEKDQSFRGELGVGAGIVWDSHTEGEYEETLLKAKFLLDPIPYFQLLETFWWTQGRENPLLPYHFERLLSSAKYFQFSIPKELQSYASFKDFLRENLREDTFQIFRIKLILSPTGELKLEKEAYEKLCWPKPIKVGLIRRKTPPHTFHYHKTTQRKEYNHLREEALRRGFTEIVFYNEANQLLEGTISNIFLEKEELLYTPPLELGILPGTLRRKLIEEKKAIEAPLTLEDLKKGATLYIGNSLRGLGKVEDWVIL